MNGATVDRQIREVTDEELEHFHDQGWVVLRGLLNPDLACQVYDTIAGDMESTSYEGEFGIIHRPSVRHQLVNSIVYSPKMGRNGLRLLRSMLPTEVTSIRYWTDNIFVKMPAGAGLTDTGTEYHQDFQIGPGSPEDRISKVNFWVALQDLPPERSTLRFFSGSHKLGLLGPRKDPDGLTVPERYPKLERWCPLSEPLHLRPGDATIHHSLMVHGAPANTTQEPRANLEFVYINPEARANGAVNTVNRGQAHIRLEPGKHFSTELVFSE
jgi:Phytanoyl-CoA dioxygenase (PhyH)